MDIYQLKYFQVIAQYMNITKAAEELNITQSALSRSLKSLEDDIGLKLFERTGHRIVLNDYGKYFLRHVDSILNSIDQAIEGTQERAGIEAGVVHVAITETIFIKDQIYHFLTKHPNVHFSCEILSESQIREQLNDGTINFAVTRRPIISKDFIWEQVMIDHMMVVFPEGHPLYGHKGGVYLNELKNERFIISNVVYNTESDVILMCEAAGFEPNILFKGIGEDLCGKLLHNNMGIMLAPYSISQGVEKLNCNSPYNKIDYGLPLLDDFANISIGILQKRNQALSLSAEEFYLDLKKSMEAANAQFLQLEL